MSKTHATTMSLDHIRKIFADTAQTEYDSWQQDENGFDEEVGCGGICDEIADKVSDALNFAGYSAHTFTILGVPNHTHVLVEFNGETYNADIPYHIYERCTGMYNFTKISGVKFEPSDVEIWLACPEEIEASLSEF